MPTIAALVERWGIHCHCKVAQSCSEHLPLLSTCCCAASCRSSGTRGDSSWRLSVEACPRTAHVSRQRAKILSSGDEAKCVKQPFTLHSSHCTSPWLLTEKTFQLYFYKLSGSLFNKTFIKLNINIVMPVVNKDAAVIVMKVKMKPLSHCHKLSVIYRLELKILYNIIVILIFNRFVTHCKFLP